MSPQEVHILAVEANEQGAELVNPGEATLIGEAQLVDLGIKQTLAPTLGLLAIAGILRDVGDQLVAEADAASVAGIKGRIGVEVGPSKAQTQSLHRFEGGLQMGLEVEGVVMVARDDACGGQDIALAIGDRQNIGGLGLLASLISHRLTAFLGNRVTAIQIQLRQVKLVVDDLNTVFPNALQAPVGTPLLEVIVDRLPTDLFFAGSSGSGAMGSCAH